MNADTKNFYWDVGNRIRTLRQVKRFTVEELAEKADISTKYMYQIENGKVRFSTEIFYKIANALGVASTALLEEESMDIGKTILFEMTGKFTSEEKAYIKEVIMREITEEI